MQFELFAKCTFLIDLHGQDCRTRLKKKKKQELSKDYELLFGII